MGNSSSCGDRCSSPATNNPQPTIIARWQESDGQDITASATARNLQRRASSTGRPIRCGARSGQEFQSLSGWRRYSIYKVRSSPPRGTGLNAEPRAPPIDGRITLGPSCLGATRRVRNLLIRWLNPSNTAAQPRPLAHFRRFPVA